MTAFEFISQKQFEHHQKYGVYADVNTKIAEWCEEFAALPKIVYAFMYCPCIHESAAAVISLHKTLKGAEIAMEFHKAEALKDFEEWAGPVNKELTEALNAEGVTDVNTYLHKFGRHESWGTKEIEIQN